MSLPRRLVSEGLGTAFLLAVVIGSGIMGERLSGGNVAIALLANSLATGGGLVVLILIFAPVSGAHFNPAVTLAVATQGILPWREVLPYIAIQVLGAFAGVAAAHLMFGEPLFFASLKIRTSGAQWWSEFVATFGLLMVIWGCVRQHITAVPYAVAAYITSAYWFTASTSFANPAVTIARAASNTFAGIRPDDVAAFVVAQLLGAAAATLVFRWLVPLLCPLPECRCAREEDCRHDRDRHHTPRALPRAPRACLALHTGGERITFPSTTFTGRHGVFLQ